MNILLKFLCRKQILIFYICSMIENSSSIFELFHFGIFHFGTIIINNNIITYNYTKNKYNKNTYKYISNNKLYIKFYLYIFCKIS